MKAQDLWPSIGIKYAASGLTLFMYSSSFVKKFGKPTILPYLVKSNNLIRSLYSSALLECEGCLSYRTLYFIHADKFSSLLVSMNYQKVVQATTYRQNTNKIILIILDHIRV
jgi:hypothetical protein